MFMIEGEQLHKKDEDDGGEDREKWREVRKLFFWDEEKWKGTSWFHLALVAKEQFAKEILYNHAMKIDLRVNYDCNAINC